VRIPRRRKIDTGELHDRWQPWLWLRLIALVLLVAYAIGFILENGKQVNVHFVFGTASVSLVWLILLSLAVGLLAGLQLAQLDRRRRRRSHQAPEPRDAVGDLVGRDEAEGEP
jgi:uncharacterized integral membrane protein